MLTLAVAVSSSHLGVFAGLVAFGFVVGIVGHVVGSRITIMTGIIIVCMVSSYYVFVLQPGSH